jgi:hypothetical protein
MPVRALGGDAERDARRLFKQLALAEEYDPSDRRQLGNFPQARATNTARNLGNATGPAELRSRRGDATAPAAAEARSRLR